MLKTENFAFMTNCMLPHVKLYFANHANPFSAVVSNKKNPEECHM